SCSSPIQILRSPENSNAGGVDLMTGERLREIAEWLERIAIDRSLPDGLPDADRERVLGAVADLYHPDRVERRRQAKVVDKQRKPARVRRADDVLHQTGIRTLRRKPVFTTPNVFPPERPDPSAAPSVLDNRASSAELQHCYVCKQKYTQIHHFYDQL